MPILNENSYYYICSGNVPTTDRNWYPATITYCSTPLMASVSFVDLNMSDTAYWYVSIFNGDAFTEFSINDVVTEEILKKIISGEIILLLSNYHEAFHSVVEGLYRQLVIIDNIPPEHILLISESADINREVQAVCQKYNKPPIQTGWCCEFEYAVQNQNLHLHNNILTLEDKYYDKKFVNFNRNLNHKIHRSSILTLLISTGLIDHGYVSAGFTGDPINWARLLDEAHRRHRDDLSTCQLLDDNVTRILNTGILSLDDNGQDIGRDHALLSNSTDYLYQNTYFSVVSETNGIRWPPLGAAWGASLAPAAC